MTMNKLIQPGDPDWRIPRDAIIGLYCAVAVSRNKFVMSLSLEGPQHALFEPYCRTLKYEDGRWTMAELETCIVSMAPCRGIPGRAPWSEPGLVTLSYDGFVRFLGDTTSEEAITGTEAAPVEEDDEWYSALATIRQIGDELFVCGSAQQLYQRSGFLGWARGDSGLRESGPKSESDVYMNFGSSVSFTDVASPDKGDNLYLCGRKGFDSGILYHRVRSDGGFKRISLPDGVGFFESVFPEDMTKIWLCGSSGTLLIGNIDDGFRRISMDPRYANIIFNNIVLYKGIYYISSDSMLFNYENGNFNRIKILNSTQVNYKFDRNILQVVDDVLWVFGHHGHVMRFDGTTWDKISIPALGGEEGHH